MVGSKEAWRPYQYPSNFLTILSSLFFSLLKNFRRVKSFFILSFSPIKRSSPLATLKSKGLPKGSVKTSHWWERGMPHANQSKADYIYEWKVPWRQPQHSSPSWHRNTRVLVARRSQCALTTSPQITYFYRIYNLWTSPDIIFVQGRLNYCFLIDI